LLSWAGAKHSTGQPRGLDLLKRLENALASPDVMQASQRRA
jgi:hypothetical protein